MSKIGGVFYLEERKERQKQLKDFIDKVDKLQEEYQIEIVSDNRFYYDLKRDIFFED